jgi:hypothetical protein
VRAKPEFQIVWIVVGFGFLVMDMLVAGELAAKLLFHDMAMFQHPRFANLDFNVTSWRWSTCAFRCWFEKINAVLIVVSGRTTARAEPNPLMRVVGDLPATLKA